MLRFDEEAHVLITREDFRQVKSQVSQIVSSLSRKMSSQVDPASFRGKEHPRRAKSPGMKLINTIFAIKSFGRAEKPFTEFKVADDKDELNVKDMIRSSSAKHKLQVSRFSLIEDEKRVGTPVR